MLDAKKTEEERQQLLKRGSQLWNWIEAKGNQPMECLNIRDRVAAELFIRYQSKGYENAAQQAFSDSNSFMETLASQYI